MSKKNVTPAVIAFFLISLGGFLLHLRIHPIPGEAEDWVPAIAGVISTFVLPFMFYNRRTVAWAYLITWAIVLIGTFGMAAHSARALQGNYTFKSVVLQSTFADILILWAKIPLAWMILQNVRPEGEGDDAA